MKKEDLMIGDWVLDTRTGKPMKVVEINYHFASLELEGEFGYQYRQYKDLQPIPNSEEFMDKNFETWCDDWKIGNGWRIRNSYGNWDMGKLNDAYETPSWWGMIDVREIHLLQHALKVCNIDKKLSL